MKYRHRPKDERFVLGIITSCSALIAWETLALITRGRVPYITTLIRRSPRGVRLGIIAGVAGVMFDHFETRRLL